MDPEADVDPDPLDPLLSAVVEVRHDAVSAGGVVDNPVDVVSEAAAVIGGVDLGVEAAPGSGEPTDVPVPGSGHAMARVKGYFEKAGFEVHAPIGTTFSIAARRSYFEQFFGSRLIVDEEHFFAPVTTAGGGDQLAVDVLPGEIRDLVQSVSLPPPPELPGGVDL